jgi:hypothetical protein
LPKSSGLRSFREFGPEGLSQRFGLEGPEDSGRRFSESLGLRACPKVQAGRVPKVRVRGYQRFGPEGLSRWFEPEGAAGLGLGACLKGSGLWIQRNGLEGLPWSSGRRMPKVSRRGLVLKVEARGLVPMVEARGFVPRQRESEGSKAQERKASRGMSPWAWGKTLEGAKSSRGDRSQTSSNRGLLAVRIRCRSEALKVRKRSGWYRDCQVRRLEARCPRYGRKEEQTPRGQSRYGDEPAGPGGGGKPLEGETPRALPA